MIAASFFSCKSAPELNSVDPFDLLDTDSALYLTVPVQPNKDFVVSAIQKVAKTAESDAEKIAERLDTAYISISPKGKMQLSANGNIPQTFVGFALSEKNGWESGVVEQQTIYTHRQTQYHLCMPTSSNAFLSNDIVPMVKKFNQIAYAGFDSTGKKTAENQEKSNLSSEKLVSETLNETAFKFLHENVATDIMLYSPNPAAFLRNFLGGVNVGTPVTSIYARFSKYQKSNDEFNVTLILNLSDPRTVKAAAAAMKLAFFPIAVKISQTAQSQITIADLPVSQKKLLSMLR